MGLACGPWTARRAAAALPSSTFGFRSVGTMKRKTRRVGAGGVAAYLGLRLRPTCGQECLSRARLPPISSQSTSDQANTPGPPRVPPYAQGGGVGARTVSGTRTQAASRGPAA